MYSSKYRSEYSYTVPVYCGEGDVRLADVAL